MLGGLAVMGTAGVVVGGEVVDDGARSWSGAVGFGVDDAVGGGRPVGGDSGALAGFDVLADFVFHGVGLLLICVTGSGLMGRTKACCRPKSSRVGRSILSA